MAISINILYLAKVIPLMCYSDTRKHFLKRFIMNDSWSDTEVELIVADYFSMLIDELKGIPISKTKHRKSLMPLLNNRTDGAIESKHQNISAVLIEMGLPFISGYKPRYNYQNQIIAKIQTYIQSHSILAVPFSEFANEVPENDQKTEFINWVVEPPENKEVIEKTKPVRRPLKINYLEVEQNNRNLGLKGEELAIEYERYSLIKAGKESLASKVKWVSKDIGDGLGFDILSKNLNGSDKYIEVKTTKLGKDCPFFFSSNEYSFSIENASNFYLYRIFNFKTAPKMFVLNGRYDSFCQMEPIQFKGHF